MRATDSFGYGFGARWRWTVCGVLLIGGLLVWWLTKPLPVFYQRAQAPVNASAPMPHLKNPTVIAAVDQEGVRPLLEPAARSPFQLEVQAPVAARPLPAPVAQVVTAPAPAPPLLALAFVGRFRSPDGVESIFVAQGQQTFELKVGQVLPNGYVVKALGSDAIDFELPSLGISARLDLPPLPSYEIR